MKYLWGISFGVVAILTIFRCGWFIPNIFNYPAWRILGKISYSVFIFHIFVVNLVLMRVYQPIYIYNFNSVRLFNFLLRFCLKEYFTVYHRSWLRFALHNHGIVLFSHRWVSNRNDDVNDLGKDQHARRPQWNQDDWIIGKITNEI